MGTTTVILLTVLIACVAVFIEYPAPEFSPQVKEWQDTGKLFKFNGHNIFYKGRSLRPQVQLYNKIFDFGMCSRDLFYFDESISRMLNFELLS